MKSYIITKLILLSLLSSCGTSKSPTTSRTKLPEKAYYIENESTGTFEPIILEKLNEPKPIQGEDQWVFDLYSEIRYPPMARENGIQGVVILEVDVDQKGVVTNVTIKKGISSDCDNEAKRAYLHSTQKGFEPLLINGRPVRFKMDKPVGFWLQ